MQAPSQSASLPRHVSPIASFTSTLLIIGNQLLFMMRTYFHFTTQLLSELSFLIFRLFPWNFHPLGVSFDILGCENLNFAESLLRHGSPHSACTQESQLTQALSLGPAFLQMVPICTGSEVIFSPASSFRTHNDSSAGQGSKAMLTYHII